MFAKVFKGLFYGSLIGQSDAQLVLVCLLTHCDRDGHVELPAPAIAALSGLPQERVHAALAVLEASDPASRTDTQEGRRLEPTGPGRWLIVNYEKYRSMRDENERREQNRQAQMRRRERLRQQASAGATTPSATVSASQQPSAHTDVEADADQHICPPDGGRAPVSPSANSRRRKTEPNGFARFYQAYPRHDGRRAGAQEFARALKRHPSYTAADLESAAVEFRKQVEHENREARFVPMARTWLAQDRFREFFDEDDDAQAQEHA